MELDGNDNVIISGDFNCPLNPSMDKKGGILIPRQHVINSIENIQNEFSLPTFGALRTPILVALRGAKCLHLFLQTRLLVDLR